jgi:hypothetical protein
MTRIVTKIGNVFAVPLDDGTKRYFQYVANDLTQLNSDVIRAFNKAYPVEAKPILQEVVNDAVSFYAHVVIKWGIQMHLWEKVGKVPQIGELKILFRSTNDYGNPAIKKSSSWHVWRVGEGFQHIGKLRGEYRKAEIGIVVTPPDIVQRMRTGGYDFVYPEME